MAGGQKVSLGGQCPPQIHLWAGKLVEKFSEQHKISVVLVKQITDDSPNTKHVLDE